MTHWVKWLLLLLLLLLLLADVEIAGGVDCGGAGAVAGGGRSLGCFFWRSHGFVDYWLLLSCCLCSSS